jgi:hypothetical protein
MQIWRLGVAVVAVVALAACSDSNDDTADTTTAPTTSTLPPTTTVAVDEAELVQSALLTVDDMPTGWTEAPNENDAQDAENAQRISDCSGLDAELIGDGVLGDTKAKSPEFSSPDSLASVKQTLGLAPDEATASAAIAAIGDDGLPPCYEEAIRTSFEEAAVTTDPAESLPDGMTLTDVSMEEIDPPATITADDVVWYKATATLDYQGQAFDIYLDLVFTRTGRVLSQIEFDGTTTPFPEALYAPTVTAAHEKIATIATT